MPFGETKVYYDGSHYIAIPHTERPKRYRPKPIEEIITVVEKEQQGSVTDEAAEPLILSENDGNADTDTTSGNIEKEPQPTEKPPTFERQITKRELFDELYLKYFDMPYKKRKLQIMYDMEQYFDSVEELKWYVDLGMERKRKNYMARQIRMERKAYLARFNYFCTFTYSDELQTEMSFKKGLQTFFRNQCHRYGWKYMGVWERSPEKQRLHFHGLFSIPDETLPGKLETVRDYSIPNHRMQESLQCDYFKKRFGRNDFKELDPRLLTDSEKYLLKYIEKSGERIVYSKGLGQFFISDIMDEDILTTFGEYDSKLLLFDNFKCWDEGLYMGRVCPEVIDKMRKCN